MTASLTALPDASEPPLVAVGRGRLLPLSWPQQHVWRIERDGHAPTAITFALRVRGPAWVSRVRRALTAIQARHEALRTRVRRRGQKVWQQVASATQMTLPVVDASRAGERIARRLVDDESRRAFDLERGPVWRALLVHFGAGDRLIVVAIHPIAGDEWSAAIVKSELAALLHSFELGTPPNLAALPVQYADYSAWQHALLASGATQPQLEYWHERLKDVPRLELPLDCAAAAGLRCRTSRSFEIAPALASELHELGRRARVTRFMTLLSAFYVIVARYSGVWDVAIGTPAANRRRTALERLVGRFVNTLVLRIQIGPERHVAALLAAVRDVTLDAYDRQDVPFEKLLEDLAPKRAADAGALAAVGFGVRPVDEGAVQSGAIRIRTWASIHGTAAFDLALWIDERYDGLRATIESPTGVFGSATLQRLADAYGGVLREMTGGLHRPARDLCPVTAADRAQVLGWASGPPAVAPDRCIHALFDEQAAAHGDRIAVNYHDEYLSYCGLFRRSNQLARYLVRSGLKAEECVAIQLPRSVESIVATLAVLKAGACYLRLDSDAPLSDRSFMLQHTGATVVLSQQETIKGLGDCGSSAVLAIDRDRERIEACATQRLDSRSSSDSLAYVIYTSGSTGQPKGVCVTHRAIRRLVCGSEYTRLTPDDRVAHASNVAFDASTFEIWGALLNGGCAVVMDTEVLFDPRQLEGRLRRDQITTLFLTTGLFHELAARTAHGGGFSGLRHLVIGGDALDPDAVRRLLETGPPARVVNGYGPTECTTLAACMLVDAPLPPAAIVPIGRPIEETELYVLDAAMEPVPVGATGELYIGGAGLARGYLHGAALTAERFLPHPFTARPGARLHKTSERGRWRADGRAEYRGRSDTQVKLISDVGSGEPQTRETAPDAPRTPLEDMIARIWRAVLNVEHVGIHSDFFDLGGHSLLAMQVVARLRDALASEVTVGMLFDAPTVAELAAQLEQDYHQMESLLAAVERLPDPLPTAPASAPLDISEPQGHD